MSERWKPENGEKYWLVHPTHKNFVDWYFWDGDDIDERNFANRNCFRTVAEAHAAAEKIKALLLSLHDNSETLQANMQDMVTNTCQAMDKGKENVAKATCTFGTLPKLTAEVFDRPDCPEWAMYAAVAMGGNVICFSNKPYPDDIGGVWHGAKEWAFISSETGGTLKCNASDWQNSLIERPARLPDWYKVGEWVYLSNEEYDKIESIDDFGINLASGAFINKKYIHEEAVSARLRPYNADEMKALVGKKVTNEEGNIYLCTAFIKETDTCNAAVDIDSWVTAGGLLEYDYTINGKPCGKFEHLENGEWVE